jgi:hypothetical protein
MKFICRQTQGADLVKMKAETGVRQQRPGVASKPPEAGRAKEQILCSI